MGHACRANDVDQLRVALVALLPCCCHCAGFEKMEKGSLGAKYTDRTNPMDKHVEHMLSVREFETSPMAPQMFGNAGREHMEKYGAISTCFPSA